MGQNRRNSMVSVMIMLPVALAVACGPAAGQRGHTAEGSAQTTSVEPRSGTVFEAVSPSTPAQSQEADLGVPFKTEPGKVSVLLGPSSFREGEKIQVTIANGLKQSIYTEDSKTDCSIIILQRWDGATWQPVLGCVVGRAPLVVAIGSGRARLVTINPFSLHLRAGTMDGSKPALRAGSYRIRFAYRLRPGPEFEEPYAAFSLAFRIRH